MHDHALGRGELGVAGRHRHVRHVADRAWAVRDRQDDVAVAGIDDLAAGHAVLVHPRLAVGFGEALACDIAHDAIDVPLRLRLDDDRVAGLEVVEVEERLTLTDAVTRYGEVADLPGQCGADVVPRALLEVALTGALHDRERVVAAEPRDVDIGDALTQRDTGLTASWQRERILAVGPFLLERGVHVVLQSVGEDVRDVDLVHDEQQHHEACGDQRLPDAAQHEPDAVACRHGRAVAGAAPAPCVLCTVAGVVQHVDGRARGPHATRPGRPTITWPGGPQITRPGGPQITRPGGPQVTVSHPFLAHPGRAYASPIG